MSDLAPCVEIGAYGLSKSYGSTAVLRELSLELYRGERLGVIGPSGGGKSTLLRCFSLLEAADVGIVRYRGVPVVNGPTLTCDPRELRANLGIVFQNFNLWPNKTVLGNIIEAPRHALGKPRAEILELGRYWLSQVGLGKHENKYPGELSGGEQQRAALARTLIMNPSILLLDEITSALDVDTTARILSLLRQLQQETQTVLFVTHHLHFAEENMDRLAVLVDGRIVEDGEPSAVLNEPHDSRTRAFLRAIKDSW